MSVIQKELIVALYASIQKLDITTVNPSDLMAWMRKAMDYITKLTPCVTFVPANSSSRNFVTIDSGPTCSSEVGMRGGEQLLYMNAGCFDRGLIVPVHELMHTLGFVHEHNRTLVLAGSWSVRKPI